MIIDTILDRRDGCAYGGGQIVHRVAEMTIQD